MRLNCRDETLQLLAEPALLEDVSFADPKLPPPGEWRPMASPLAFKVEGSRLAANEAVYLAELRREGAKEAEAAPLAAAVARSLSGVACWPRLVLDPAGELVVESRGPHGESQKSHWQTVLPLLAARPVAVAPGDSVLVDVRVTLGAAVDAPPRYAFTGEVSPSSA